LGNLIEKKSNCFRRLEAVDLL